jgi:tRNA pseudouridine38-40 synthase
MALWKSILTYDGSGYNGWQIQPGQPTIQGALTQAIHHVTGETTLPQGSGRTDSGVHALGQVASFFTSIHIPAANLHRALNRALPPAIRILSLEPAPLGFHARHSSIAKTYEYRIFPARPKNPSPQPNFQPDSRLNPMPRICSPMLAPYVWDCHLPLDQKALQQTAQSILGTHDFTSFAASDPDQATRRQTVSDPASDEPIRSTNIRTIHHSHWNFEPNLLTYRITGNGFLHHMVRNLVGTFVEAACGRIRADSIARVFAAGNRSAAGPTAPPQGLFLIEVHYPENHLFPAETR